MKIKKSGSKSRYKKINSRNTSYIPQQIEWGDLLKSKWLIPSVLLSILIVLFTFRTIYNYDLGFHLRGGQFIIENLSVPDYDVYTYTVNENKYIDMHWFYQLIVFGVYNLFGYTGITFMHTIFVLIVFYLLLRRMMFYGVPDWLTVLTLLLVLITIQIRFFFRPELVTWIGILLTLIVMDQYFCFKKKHLYFLMIIMLVWVNCQGLFIIGLFIIGAYFISMWVHEKKFDKYLFTWFVVSILVTFINPYFEKIVLQPFYLFTRLSSSSIFKTTISEFNSPFVHTASLDKLSLEIYSYYAICILSFALFIITIKKRKLHEFLILAAFFYISYSQIRNIPIFVIYAINIIVISLNGILKERNKVKEFSEKFKSVSRIIPYVVSVVIILIALRMYNNAYFASYDMGIDFGIGLNENVLPVKSSEFLLQNKLDGRIINQLGFGSWFVWKLPQPVFIDGRLEVMKEDFYSEYQNSFLQGELKRLIDKYNPQLIAFNYAFTNNWIPQLKNIHGWRVIYLDDNSIIYARYDYALNIPVMNEDDVINGLGLDTNITEQKITEIFKTKPKTRISNWLSGFYKKWENYTGLMNLALYAIENENLRAAEIIYLHIIKNANGRFNDYLLNLYNNLGNIYFIRHDFNKALYCYHIYLKNFPDDEHLKEKVEFLESQTGLSY